MLSVFYHQNLLVLRQKVRQNLDIFIQEPTWVQPTDQPKRSLREGQRAGVEKEVKVVCAVLQGEHAEHHQEKASLRNRPQAWS